MIGQRIKASRKAKGLTQLGLALLIKVDPHTVSYYERGAWPVPPKRLAQIADVLDDPSLLTASEGPETLRIVEGNQHTSP